MGALQTFIITVPCFNEARRLDFGEFARLLRDSPVSHLLFVDDGSTDDTSSVIAEFVREHAERATLLTLPANVGKAEAVRSGLLHSLASHPDAIGYIDADLATPVDEVCRLVDVLLSTDFGAVLGSRVAHLGANVDRSPARHYLGRLFATMASFALSTAVYDTQCGAKFFRDTPEFRSSIETPFLSKWAFDVELLGRLMAQNVSILEVPLKKWQDVGGSKMRLSSMLKSGLDVVRIGVKLRKR